MADRYASSNIASLPFLNGQAVILRHLLKEKEYRCEWCHWQVWIAPFSPVSHLHTKPQVLQCNLQDFHKRGRCCGRRISNSHV